MTDDHAPKSPEAEEAVIGSLLVIGSVPPTVELLLRAEMFTRPTWREVYAGCVEASVSGVPVDLVVVADRAARAINRPATEVSAALIAAMAATPTSAHVEHYARIVRREWQRRDLLAIAGSAAKLAHTETDVPGVVAMLHARLDQVDDEAALAESGELGPHLERARREQLEGVAPGWPTGVDRYDQWSHGGLRRKQLHLIGGESGVGKSMLVTRIVAGVADHGASVCLFSLEMSIEEMGVRLCAGYMGGAALKLHNREAFSGAEEAAFVEAERRVLASGVRVFDTAYGLSGIRALTRLNRPDVVVVDFVQNMDWPPGDWKREDQAIDVNMRGLAKLAKIEDCCVIAVSQLNNDGVREGRGGVPTITAFRGSGGIAHVANLAVVLTQGEIPGTVQLWNVKNRHGAKGEPGTYALATATGLLVPVDPALVRANGAARSVPRGDR